MIILLAEFDLLIKCLFNKFNLLLVPLCCYARGKKIAPAGQDLV